MAAKKNAIIPLVLAAALLSVDVSLCYPSTSVWQTADEIHYRGGEFGDVNTLWLMMKLHGILTEHSEIESDLRTRGRTSLKTLCESAIHFGLNCEVVKISPSQLESANAPTIIHLDSLLGSESRFAVFIKANTRKGHQLFDGNSALIVDAPIDEFRQSWSGYAITATKLHSNTWLRPLVFGVSVILVVLIVLRNIGLVSRMRRCFWFALVSLACFTNPAIGCQNEAKKELPNDIRQALASYVDRLTSGTCCWRHEITLGNNLKHFDQINQQFDKEVIFRWQNQMMRVMAKRFELSPAGQTKYLSNKELAYDGETIYIGSGSTTEDQKFESGILIIEPMQEFQQARMDNYVYAPQFFENCGVWFPARFRDYPALPRSWLLNLIDQENAIVLSVDRLMYLGIDCVEIGVSYDGGKQFMIFDPNREYCMLETKKFDTSGRLVSLTSVKSFLTLENQRFVIPKHVQVEEFSGADKVDATHDYFVDRFDLEPIPKQVFQLSYDNAGTLISDRRGSDPSIIVMPAKISDLENSIVLARRRSVFTRQNNYQILLMSSAAICGVLVCFLFLLKRKSARR